MFAIHAWDTKMAHRVLLVARPWKHPNSGVYYLPVRVPIDLVGLVGLVGRLFEEQSLRTKEVGEARLRVST